MLIKEAIAAAGHEGKVKIAMDCAASGAFSSLLFLFFFLVLS